MKEPEGRVGVAPAAPLMDVNPPHADEKNMPRPSRTIAALSALALLSALARPAFADCAKDMDCKGERVCEGGRCVEMGRRSSGSELPEAAEPLPPVAAPTTETPEQPAAAAAPGAVSVAIKASNEADHYTVSAGGGRCATPCVLQLAPGKQHLEISGAKEFERDVEVPDGPSTLSISHGCRGCTVGGWVALGVGLPVAIIGIALIAAKSKSSYTPTSYSSSSSYRPSTSSSSGQKAGGAVLTVVGVLGVVLGTVLIATSGSNRATVTRAAARPALRFVGLDIAPAPPPLDERAGRAQRGGSVEAAFTF